MIKHNSQSSFFSLVFISCSWPLDSLLKRANVLTNWRKLIDSTDILGSRLLNVDTQQFSLSNTPWPLNVDSLISEESFNDPCSQWIDCQLRNEHQVLTTVGNIRLNTGHGENRKLSTDDQVLTLGSLYFSCPSGQTSSTVCGSDFRWLRKERSYSVTSTGLYEW